VTFSYCSQPEYVGRKHNLYAFVWILILQFLPNLKWSIVGDIGSYSLVAQMASLISFLKRLRLFKV
jgi:hypothetical protein